MTQVTQIRPCKVATVAVSAKARKPRVILSGGLMFDPVMDVHSQRWIALPDNDNARPKMWSGLSPVAGTPRRTLNAEATPPPAIPDRSPVRATSRATRDEVDDTDHDALFDRINHFITLLEDSGRSFFKDPPQAQHAAANKKSRVKGR